VLLHTLLHTLHHTLLRRFGLFNTILTGAFIAGLSPWIMTFGANYFCAFVFVFTLSIGESLYSPCVYTYTMNTADKGREGTYMALGNLPTFTATLVSGIMSG